MSKQPDVFHDKCKRYLPRKARLCRLSRWKDSDFCVEHLDTNDLSAERVPCPFDPLQYAFNAISFRKSKRLFSTVEAKALQSHLNRCNSRPKPVPRHFSADVNVPAPSISEIPDKTGLNDAASILKLIAKVEAIYADVKMDISSEIKSHFDPVSFNASQNNNDPNTLVPYTKHTVQISSLLGHLDEGGLLSGDEEVCFMEFGAGRGELSRYVSEATATKKASFVLLDRSNCRNKRDNLIRASRPGRFVERLDMDIKDLCLDKYAPTFDSAQTCIISKHLCGSATDLTINCLANCFEKRMDSVLIALCCHHRCEYATYCNRGFLHEFDITPRDFALIISLSGWATCAPPPRSETSEPDGQVQVSEDEAILDALSPDQRTEIGLKCKRVLDYGRLLKLKQLGYDARLAYYIDRSVSLENVLLVAHPSCPPNDKQKIGCVVDL